VPPHQDDARRLGLARRRRRRRSLLLLRLLRELCLVLRMGQLSALLRGHSGRSGRRRRAASLGVERLKQLDPASMEERRGNKQEG
jgi:hypothetical protein